MPLLFRFCKSVADTPPAGGRRLARRGMLQGLAPGPDVARGQQAEGRTGQQMGAPVAREAEYDAQAAGGQQRAQLQLTRAQPQRGRLSPPQQTGQRGCAGPRAPAAAAIRRAAQLRQGRLQIPADAVQIRIRRQKQQNGA